jgi:hypothetical protein
MSILDQTRIQDDLALLEESLEAARFSILPKLPSESPEYQAITGALKAFDSLQESQKQGAFRGRSFDAASFLRKLWPTFVAASDLSIGSRLSFCQFGVGEIPKELTQPVTAIFLAWAKGLIQESPDGAASSAASLFATIDASEREVSLALGFSRAVGASVNLPESTLNRVRLIVAENGGWLEVRSIGTGKSTLFVKLVRPSLRTRFFTLKTQGEWALVPHQMCRVVPSSEPALSNAFYAEFYGQEEGFRFQLAKPERPSAYELEVRLADRMVRFLSDDGYEDILARVVPAKSWVQKGSWFQELGVAVDEAGRTSCIPILDLKKLLGRLEDEVASA